MRIALIHATPLAIQPVEDAFARHWPAAERMNVLDDRLSADRTLTTDLTDEMARRILALAEYGQSAGADGILFTCSAFGPAIEHASKTLPLPVLKPNQAMFDEALTSAARFGLLASFPSSLAPMHAELLETAQRAGQKIELEALADPDAMTALQAGDGPAHDALLASKAEGFENVDAIMLAQFSTARARESVAAATGLPVLTSPDSAVCAMRARFQS